MRKVTVIVVLLGTYITTKLCKEKLLNKLSNSYDYELVI